MCSTSMLSLSLETYPEDNFPIPIRIQLSINSLGLVKLSSGLSKLFLRSHLIQPSTLGTIITDSVIISYHSNIAVSITLRYETRETLTTCSSHSPRFSQRMFNPHFHLFGLGHLLTLKDWSVSIQPYLSNPDLYRLHHIP